MIAAKQRTVVAECNSCWRYPLAYDRRTQRCKLPWFVERFMEQYSPQATVFTARCCAVAASAIQPMLWPCICLIVRLSVTSQC